MSIHNIDFCGVIAKIIVLLLFNTPLICSLEATYMMPRRQARSHSGLQETLKTK